jgi:hypothetical protein
MSLPTPKEYKHSAGVVYIGKIVDKECFSKFNGDVNKKELDGEMSFSCFVNGEDFILIEMFDCKKFLF